MYISVAGLGGAAEVSENPVQHSEPDAMIESY